eukprot:196404-Alexandrium_andersonii.AAC.1
MAGAPLPRAGDHPPALEPRNLRRAAPPEVAPGLVADTLPELGRPRKRRTARGCPGAPGRRCRARR